MKMTGKVFSISLGLALCLFAGPLLFSQEGSHTAAQTTTVVGCLQQGETAETFILIEEESGKKITVTGTADLAKHLSHKVELTGSYSGAETFKAEKVKHLSTACE